MKKRLGEILITKGLLSKGDLQEALKEQVESKKPIGEILIKQGKISEKEMLGALSEQLQIDFVDLKKITIAPEAIQALPAKLVTYYKIMPVAREKNQLTIAVSDPFNRWPLDDIEVNAGFHPKIVLAPLGDIQEAIRKHYGVGAETVEQILRKDETSFAAEDLKKKEEERTQVIPETGEGGAKEATVVRLVDQILQEAVRRKATDIHVEHSRNSMTVRYRVDGILSDAKLPMDIRYLANAVISRIKIMSWMDIVEKRLPQDGRSRIKIGQEEFDLRVSSLPSRFGEDIAIRLLPSKVDFHFENLGMKEATLKSFEQLIRRPNGIIFVTGPTGSGKSTTLYTCLSKINSKELKIVTVEDPVEYELSGITQIQVNNPIGLSFARTLRNILRHDPDVIMVGEVRDTETAKIAVQASLTGHLVFSTLHTNDAASGITRLVDMGIDPFLIASSVNAFVAQRLIRLTCEECKKRLEEKEESPLLGRVPVQFAKAAKGKLLRGKGCESCGQTGYRGRTAIYEVLMIDDEIRRLVLSKTAANEIKAAGRKHGMITLREDGWEKAVLGITTAEEVLRVTEEDTEVK